MKAPAVLRRVVRDLTETEVALLRVASPGHMGEARDAIDLITERGYDRGKDLHAELAFFLARAR